MTQARRFTNVVRRHTGCIVIYVQDSNPNGRIEDGFPRTTPDDRGWITPMCAKRQIRELLEDHTSPAFAEIVKRCGMKPDQLHIFESHKKGFAGKSDMEAKKAAMDLFEKAPEEALDRYVDVRLFGTTALEGDKGGKSGKGKNGEETAKKSRFIRTGCVQFSTLTSVAPVEVIVAGLSKKAPLRNDVSEGQGDLAPDAFRVVKSGLYVGSFYVCENEAVKTRATADDINLLMQLIPHMFFRRAAQRARVSVVSALVAEHDNPMGSFRDEDFLTACQPSLKNGQANSLSDYSIPTAKDVVSAMKEKGKTIKIMDLCLTE